MSNYRDEFLENTYYLVFNQWFNKNILFENSDDYKTFVLYAMQHLIEMPQLVMSAYCILPSYFYFVIKNKEHWLMLSDFMRKVQVSYAMYLKKKEKNQENSKWLPVFGWRFKANIIEEESLEDIESCVAFEPIKNEFVEDIKSRPHTSAHQVIETWYDCMSDTHIKIYNEWRKLYKKTFDD